MAAAPKSAVQFVEQQNLTRPSEPDFPDPSDAGDDTTPQAEAGAPEDNYVSDSGFDSGGLLVDETDTLASSILNYRIENGRQYHAYRDGAYWGVR